MFKQAKNNLMRACATGPLAVAACVSIATMTPTDALAQNAGDDEIVVTAQRRAEDLQDVPISVAAVSADELTRSVTLETRDLPSVVPGLQFNQSLGAGQTYVRGVGQLLGQIGTEPPIAVYVDGVYLPQSQGSIFSFNNISQIALLRGPQSTLFGRNATGGVLQINTRMPNATPSIAAEASYGNNEIAVGRFYANGQLADGFYGSIAAFAKDQGEAFGFNQGTGHDIFESEESGGQVRFLWDADENTTFGLNVIQTDQRGSFGAAAGVFPGSLGADGVTRFMGDGYVVNLAVDPYAEVSQTIAALQGERRFGDVSLQSTLSYRTMDEGILYETNGIPARTLPPAPGSAGPIVSRQNNTAETMTFEVLLQSADDGPFVWTAGFYYLNDDITINQRVHIEDVGTQINNNVSSQVTESYAVFGQGTLAITPDLRLTLGARYTMDERSVEGVSLSPAGVVTNTFALAAAANGFSTTLEEEEPTYRVALDYRLSPSTLAYVSYNRGFKSGTYSHSGFSNRPTEPEYVDAYEIGLNNEFFGGRFRLNGSYFYYDYTNIQLRAQDPPSPLIILKNAAESEIQGIDIDFDWQATSQLSFSGGAEFLDATFTSLPNFACPVPGPPGGNPGAGVICDLSGHDMPHAPDFSGNIAAFYEVPFANESSLNFSTNIYYNSGFGLDTPGRIQQEAYTSVSASVGWWSPGETWGIELWGRNLTDELIFSNGVEAGSDVGSPTAPRLYGITLRYRN